MTARYRGNLVITKKQLEEILDMKEGSLLEIFFENDNRIIAVHSDRDKGAFDIDEGGLVPETKYISKKIPKASEGDELMKFFFKGE